MRMNCMSCSTTMMAARSLISRINSAVRAVSSCVMPAAGSSSRTSQGSAATTMPSSTHWRWPCANRPTISRRISPSRNRSTVSVVSEPARRAPCQRRADSQMFSSTDSPSNTLGTCVFMPTPRPATSCGSEPVVSSPRILISPAVGTSWPVRHLKKVDLPAPFGPIRQRSSLSYRVKSTWSTARTPPKCMDNPRVSTITGRRSLRRLMRPLLPASVCGTLACVHVSSVSGVLRTNR